MDRCYQHARRAPGSLNDRQVHELGVRISRFTRRIGVEQGEQIAQLCARIGVAYASRPKLALMLSIGRRTLDRVLAELDGKALVVVAERGRGGGTVLIPLWRPVDPANLDAFIRGAMSRARRVPVRAWAVLRRALAKIRQPWQIESPCLIDNPCLESSSPTPAENPEASKDLQEGDPPLLVASICKPPTTDPYFQREQAKLVDYLAGIAARIRPPSDHHAARQQAIVTTAGTLGAD